MRRREYQLTEAQRLAGLGSWEWDVRSNTVTWSDELYRIYGLEPGEFGASLEAYLERVHPEDRDNTKSVVEQAVHNPKPFYFEERILRPDGEVRVLYSSGNVATDDEGQAIRLIGICLDITERKRAEETLQYRLNMERLVSNISSEFINLSIDQIDSGINQALEKITKFTSTVRALVFQVSPDNDALILSHEWCDPVNEVEIGIGKSFSLEELVDFWEILNRQEEIIIRRPTDIPPETFGPHQWTRQDQFCPILFVPMLLNENLYGALGICCQAATEREWPESFLPLPKACEQYFCECP